jgi:hypothetical protein
MQCARLAVQTSCMHAAGLHITTPAQMWHMPFLGRYSIWDAISRSDVPQGTYLGMASPCSRPCAAGVAAERPPSHRLCLSQPSEICRSV